MKTTLARLAPVLSEVTDKDVSLIEAAPEALKLEELLNDSLEWVEATIAVEAEFDIEISDDEVEHMKADQATVRGLVTFIDGKLKEKADAEG